MTFPPGFDIKIDQWFVDNGLIKPSDFTMRAGLHYDLIREWSNRMNIVSKNDLEILLERHILDSLTPITSIPDKGRLIDIGSGGGFPGIPIALIRPELKIILLESRHKKALFLQEAKKQLKLDNVSVEECRLEAFTSNSPFDIATIRALPQWEKHLKRIKSLLRPEGYIIYYKRLGESEIINL
ncbi:MAG: 16S rRNA (guanine(527)-N(7))-methyltransferase RsmG [candidate division Zixibacteria bacterium]